MEGGKEVERGIGPDGVNAKKEESKIEDSGYNFTNLRDGYVQTE
jgi:hypothetical protein